jgi:pentose-5-phosphate-3-epimerase
LGAFTREQILTKISLYSEAIDAVMLGQQYSINTGQGSQSVTRANLKQLEMSLAMWEERLNEIDGQSNLISIRGVR